MKSFVNFFKTSKDSLVDSAQNLFGKKKEIPKQPSDIMEEEIIPNQTQHSIFDEETYYTYLRQATEHLKVLNPSSQSGNNSNEYLYELTCSLAYKEIIKVRQQFSLQRKNALNDLDYYSRLIQTELNYEQLIQSITLSFLTQKMGINNYSLASMLLPLEQLINKRVSKEMCTRVLFSKEEILSHIDTYGKIDLTNYNIRILQYHASPLITLEKLMNDIVGLQTGIDEEELYCFKVLFGDDNEVQEGFKKKALFLQQIFQAYQ